MGRRERTLPPGPPTLPVLGNLHLLPKKYLYKQLSAWAREYGDFYSLKLGPRTVVVLSSATAVKDFMDKRTGLTAGRPSMHFAEVAADDVHLAVIDYGDAWRSMRRAAHTLLTSTAVSKYIPIQEAEASQLLYDMLHDPDWVYRHIQRTTVSTMTTVLSGKRCPRFQTKLATDFYHTVERLGALLTPGNHPPVDIIPLLKYVPRRWAAWKSLSEDLGRDRRRLFEPLVDECEKRVYASEEVGCFMEEVVRNEGFGLSRDLQIGLLGTLLDGGADTTAAFLQSLVTLLGGFPDIQHKAQEEMDTVVGHDRMPDIGDIENLPYCRALTKEVFRWRPIFPIGIPHKTRFDDQFRGFSIPKGTTVIINTWGLYHDPDAFDNPGNFDPDRYLHSEFGTREGHDDSAFRHTFNFGSGRRLCPGMPFAMNTINMTTMQFIWAFTFGPPHDPVSKHPMPADPHSYLNGVGITPSPFACAIAVRSAGKAEMIDLGFAEAIRAFEKYERGLDAEERGWVERNRVVP